MNASHVRLTGVRKHYGRREVLRGIDLEVARHEVVALIGSSGSGKSTLLKTINGLERIDDGHLDVGGIDVASPRTDLDRLRAGIGFVFQSYNLFPHRTVADNVSIALRLVHGMPRGAAATRSREVLERVGLGPHVDAYPDRLSGGQQQRAAIARAIAAGQELLLLDEVTSALDPELVGEVLDLVRDLKARGTTIVMATHEMAFARDVADRVVFLDDGLIRESGTPEQVLGASQEERTRQFLARFLDR